jgi:hypothetical protein
MKWLRTICREILGLFVDDGSFAVASWYGWGLPGLSQGTSGQQTHGALLPYPLAWCSF